MDSDALTRAQRFLEAGQGSKAVEELELHLRGAQTDTRVAAWLAQLHWKLGNPQAALDVCERSRRAVSGDIPLLVLQAQIHAALGDPDSGLALLDRVPESGAHAGALLSLRASLAVAAGQYGRALEIADAALAAGGSDVALLSNRCVALLHLRRLQEASAAADRLLEEVPERVEGYLNKAAVLLQLQRFADATEILRRGLLLEPTNLGLQINLGTALLGLGRAQEALQVSDAGLAGSPHVSGLLGNRALALEELGDWDGAILAALNAFARDPGSSEFVNGRVKEFLGHHDAGRLLRVVDRCGDELSQAVASALAAASKFLLTQNRLEDACQLASALRRMRQDDFSALMLEARALAATKRFDEADSVLALAAIRNPEALMTGNLPDGDGAPPDAWRRPSDARLLYTDWVMECLARWDWTDYGRRTEEIRCRTVAALEKGVLPPVRNYQTLFLPFEPALRLRVAQQTASHIASHVAQACAGYVGHSPAIGAPRLRIGYVSADYRDHATSHLARSMFAQHNRQDFEIYGYALRPDDGSAYRAEIMAGCDHFIDLTGLTVSEMARRISSDGMHILVDLGGYTKYARPEVFALRPAPIQVSFLAYAGTLGASWMDYIVVDPIVLPEHEVQCYAEAPVFLPNSYQVNYPWEPPPPAVPHLRADEGLPTSGFVYAGFHNPMKITPAIFDLWARILRQVPNAVLWLLDTTLDGAENLRREASRRGLDEDRLVLALFRQRETHLQRLQLADLFLDTPVFNAHTNASDALRACVPVVTVPGFGFPGKVAGSLLKAVGLPELVKDDYAAYEATAVRLGREPQLAASLKQKLRRNNAGAPLFNMAAYVAHLERAYRAMWERHIGGTRPAPIRIALGTEY